jgi:hypothetical protein
VGLFRQWRTAREDAPGRVKKGVAVSLKNVVFCLAGLVLCFVFVHAAEKNFWTLKPYTEWNEDEVAKLLKNSPWSKSMDIVLGTMGGDQGGSGGSRGSGGMSRGGGGGIEDVGDSGGSGGGMGGGGGRGGRGGSTGAPSMRSMHVIVTWYSKIVREAMARSIILRNPEPSKEALDSLLNYRDTSYFNILVIGWSGGFRVAREEAIQKLKKETFLVKKTKEKIPVADLMLPDGRGKPLVLLFPKEANGKPTLTLEDKEVTLQTKVGENTIRAIFKLAEMTVNGEPAL